jgi:diaminohydroxyphosphoribosylaminopyrimidine deaminase/5-amino-6-(5-phosphoribosylamino)uracil reductase
VGTQAKRDTIDRAYLKQALTLAARGRGRTRPNPMVGALVVRDGRVVGRGWHTRAGAPHAEAVALLQAGEQARGARLYVNLEPCCHFGRTPPCTDAILASGVSEVVACMRDPDPRVNGRGFARLRRGGVQVRSGLLRGEAVRLNEAFVVAQRRGLPVVTLKAGMSLDGRIATSGGRSRWITSAAARAAARRLRARHDAVLVGVGTLLADDPVLSANGHAPHDGSGPVRVVLDSRLRTPPRARVLRTEGGPVVVVTRRGAPASRRRRLERAGALVVEVPGKGTRVDLRGALRALAGYGIASVLIEGGGEVLGAALDAAVGDRVALYVAPRLLGGTLARPAFAGRGAARPESSARLREIKVTRIDRDFLIEGRLEHPGGRRSGQGRGVEAIRRRERS